MFLIQFLQFIRVIAASTYAVLDLALCTTKIMCGYETFSAESIAEIRFALEVSFFFLGKCVRGRKNAPQGSHWGEEEGRRGIGPP